MYDNRPPVGRRSAPRRHLDGAASGVGAVCWTLPLLHGAVHHQLAVRPLLQVPGGAGRQQAAQVSQGAAGVSR